MNNNKLASALNLAVMCDAATARVKDLNGWWEVKDNPLSKVGVFPYEGARIPGGKSEKVYQIYRPAEELSSPAFLDSLKLIPWVDEHAMLGPESEGKIPAERYGVHGATGEKIWFDGQYVRGNIKVFSEHVKNQIESGKRELSLGYECEIDMTPGEWNGIRYDGIQRQLRANHVALVQEGRMGPDVAVMDGKTMDRVTFTVDTLEHIQMADETTTESKDPTLADVMSVLEKIGPLLEKLNAIQGAPASAEPEMDETPAPAASEEPPVMDADPEKKAEGMDTKALLNRIAALEKKLTDNSVGNLKTAIAQDTAARIKLASKAAPVIGVFDHAAMTHEDCVAYVADKMGVDKSEAAIDAYLKGRGAPAAVAMDSAPKSDAIDEYLKGKE